MGHRTRRGRLCQIVNPPIALLPLCYAARRRRLLLAIGGITLTAVVAPHLLDGPERGERPGQHGLTAPRESCGASRSGRAPHPALPIGPAALLHRRRRQGDCADYRRRPRSGVHPAGAAGAAYLPGYRDVLHDWLARRRLPAAGPGGGRGGPPDRQPHLDARRPGRPAAPSRAQRTHPGQPRDPRGYGRAPGPVPCSLRGVVAHRAAAMRAHADDPGQLVRQPAGLGPAWSPAHSPHHHEDHPAWIDHPGARRRRQPCRDGAGAGASSCPDCWPRATTSRPHDAGPLARPDPAINQASPGLRRRAARPGRGAPAQARPAGPRTCPGCRRRPGTSAKATPSAA